MAGGLAIVSMGSRESSDDRMRSNRLARGMSTADTPPDEMDLVVANLIFNGADGGFGTLPHYLNISAPQVIGNILALPMDGPQDGALSEGRVHFFNISDPASPNSEELNAVPMPDSGA